MGSTDHSLLMSCAPDVHHFLVVGSTNSTLDLEALATDIKCNVISENPELQVKNTFLTYEFGDPPLERLPRSYSDTDLHRLSNDNLDPLFANSDVIGLDSKHSGTSSSVSKSEVSSSSGNTVTEIRVGTQVVQAQKGNGSVSQGTGVMRLSDYNNLPVDERGVRLSAASHIHGDDQRRPKCRKCAFHMDNIKPGKMCKNGALCDFCHGQHKRPFKHLVK